MILSYAKGKTEDEEVSSVINIINVDVGRAKLHLQSCSLGLDPHI